MAAATPTAQVKPPFWRNVRVLRWAFQAVFLILVIAFLLYLWGNLTGNLERLGIRTDFRFLRQPAGFAIPDSDFRSSQSVWDAFLVGARNTAVVSILGIVFATILGVLVGVARLSSNWLVRRAAALYVETLRNIPVLIIIIFWWAGILIRLPSLDENELFGLVNLSNRGLVLPWLDRTADLTFFLVAVLVTVVAAALVIRWRTRRFDATGEPHHRVLWGLGVVLVGLTRLSSNWLVRRAAALYVETLRNIPVLIIIIFWWAGILIRLPSLDENELFGLVNLSNRGLVLPWLDRTGDLTLFLVVVLVTTVAAALVIRWRTRRFDATGQPHHRVLWGLGVALAGVTLAYLVTGRPFTTSLPEVGSFGTTGGFRLSPEFGALLIALTLYTASHIAEIVRGSILSVQQGQSEASNALGLSGFQRLRHVVLPQAFRVSVPPLANQYLNLTKNSSLGIAIGYYELTRIARISISQAAPAPQATLVLMLFYLAFSLFIALVTNIVNRRLEIKGR